jgi:hypothetical protein
MGQTLQTEIAWADEDAKAIRIDPRQLPQPLKSGASSRQPRHLQTTTLSRPG